MTLGGGLFLPLVFVLAGGFLSHRMALEELGLRASTLATEVLERGHAISDQFDHAFRELQAGPEPCSPESIALMRQLTLNAYFIQAFGYMRGSRLVCSSYGLHAEDVKLGPPAYVSQLDYEIHMDVGLPDAVDSSYVVSTHRGSGYSAFVLPHLALDLLRDRENIGLGLLSQKGGRPIVQRGYLGETWLFHLGPESRLWQEGGYFFAWQPSTRYDYGAYIALPLTEFVPLWRRQALVLLPVSLLAGLACQAALNAWRRRRASMRFQLRRGLQRGEFQLCYLPIVELETGRWVGAEALLRWRRPDRIALGPDIFVPLAERSELMPELTRYVIDKVLAETGGLLRRTPDFRISINLSGRDLADPAFMAYLADAIQLAAVLPDQLTLELNERVLVDAEGARSGLGALRDAGYQVAIDDFGTGYSGLSYLSALHVNAIKIDRVFVEALGTDAVTRDVVEHIIGIGRDLGLQMVAEGVQTGAQASYLRAQGVQYAQGWLYARPMPVDQLRARLLGAREAIK